VSERNEYILRERESPSFASHRKIVKERRGREEEGRVWR